MFNDKEKALLLRGTEFLKKDESVYKDYSKEEKEILDSARQKLIIWFTGSKCYPWAMFLSPMDVFSGMENLLKATTPCLEFFGTCQVKMKGDKL